MFRIGVFLEHSDFLLASGSVIGREHRNINVPKNNQDGLTIVRKKKRTVAVVTDGCGSSPHSEVGAQLGAHFVAEAVADRARRGISSEHEWDYTLHSILNCIRDTTRMMYGNPAIHVVNYFLFTIVGVLLTDRQATFFAVGDGVVVVNGELTKLGPFPDNEPPYAAYGLLGKTDTKIRIVARCALPELQNFLIGTDGVTHLAESAEKKLPGIQEPVGELSQFWQPRYFDADKPDLLNRRLRMIGRDWPRRDPEPGLLPDDTTMIVGRNSLT
jgi:hypothetical protein